MCMIERVALVLTRVNLMADRTEDLGGDDYSDLARAAIEAMREPTEAMLDAHETRMRTSLPGQTHLRSEALQAWRAMIDAALI